MGIRNCVGRSTGSTVDNYCSGLFQKISLKYRLPYGPPTPFRPNFVQLKKYVVSILVPNCWYQNGVVPVNWYQFSCPSKVIISVIQKDLNKKNWKAYHYHAPKGDSWCNLVSSNRYLVFQVQIKDIFNSWCRNGTSFFKLHIFLVEKIAK